MISNIGTIRVFVAEGREVARYEQKVEQAYKVAKQVQPSCLTPFLCCVAGVVHCAAICVSRG